MDKMTIVIVVLGTLSILPLLFTLIKMRMLQNFRKKGITTTATIIHVEEHYRAKGGYYYYLTFTYKTIHGEGYTARSVDHKKRQPGDTIPLTYLLEKPTKFSVDNGKRLPYIAAFSIVFFFLIIWFCYWLSNLEYTQQ